MCGRGSAELDALLAAGRIGRAYEAELCDTATRAVV